MLHRRGIFRFNDRPDDFCKETILARVFRSLYTFQKAAAQPPLDKDKNYPFGNQCRLDPLVTGMKYPEPSYEGNQKAVHMVENFFSKLSQASKGISEAKRCGIWRKELLLKAHLDVTTKI